MRPQSAAVLFQIPIMSHLETVLPALIIDPQMKMAPALSPLLAEVGWPKAEAVDNPVDALTALREKNFGLVITDWTMEPMDAGELIKTMRADKVFDTVPIMIVTANPDPAQFVAAQDQGADAYAVVPFGAETLTLKLDRLRIKRS